jgi:valyl-tRNA synthetase
MESYRFDHMAQAIYEFTWNEYCDWYLELSKPVLTNPDSSIEAQRGTRQTLIRVLETLLRLAHPLLPFITEEIWQRIAPLAGVTADNRPSIDTIMLQPYPQADDTLIDAIAMDEIDWVKDFILGVRKIRSSMDIKPGKPLPVLLQNGSEGDKNRLQDNLHYLKSLGRIESVQWLDDKEEAPESATSLVGEMKILIPMAGLIDKEAERARLNKEISKRNNEIARVESKLSNANFVDKAPPAVVEKERQKLNDLKTSLQQLTEQLAKISNL